MGGDYAGLPAMDWSQYDTFPGSFEKCSLVTAALTHLGLYILMLLGFVNQLLFRPKVATERNREFAGGPRVSHMLKVIVDRKRVRPAREAREVMT
ncbi:hypothetical protein RR46_05041 [Papilio xuthus]|uniref:Uncharacterized protein n=1 Tax=Papilio xuthus TaxID=66420 RepID=A0A194PU27_PAPXU|nr:hypothetical protein RR46_05041 [Papilio xuthus]